MQLSRFNAGPCAQLRVQHARVTPGCHSAHCVPRPTPSPAVCRAQPQYYPDAEEDSDVLKNAFHAAYEETKPAPLRVPGLQEFAAAIWQRRRAIPSQSYVDPIMHLFQEYDQDNDGVLEAHEIASAFQSHGVRIEAEQIEELIIAYEDGRDLVIKKEEWPEFVHALATSDLHVKEHIRESSIESSDDGL